MKGRARVISDRITPSLDRVETSIEQVPQRAFEYFRSITPIDQGQARRRTRLTGNRIVADYPYAQRLDQGYSDQAPDGMTQPTIEYVEQLVDQIIRRK